MILGSTKLLFLSKLFLGPDSVKKLLSYFNIPFSKTKYHELIKGALYEQKILIFALLLVNMVV